jgi:putative DNA methylase
MFYAIAGGALLAVLTTFSLFSDTGTPTRNNVNAKAGRIEPPRLRSASLRVHSGTTSRSRICAKPVTGMKQAKKLIEVAMPIKEISAESVRDKSIRHGHISTLHLWWARRPLPVCRAVVFASLVPDPLDEDCPQAFRDAFKLLLDRQNGVDVYKPYEDIPYTAAPDPMEDNLRNRLLMFIGKFSDTYIENEKRGKITPAKDQLSSASLIKWDNKNDEEIIGKARRLIWVAHNAKNGASATELLADFDKHYGAIKSAVSELYNTPDRHVESEAVKQKEASLHKAIEAFLDKMPRVFDPFAGGGAIPLEASRLGCRSYGNDINPVAHIIQKGSLEFPQKYGKPIIYSRDKFIQRYGEEEYRGFVADNPLYAASGKVKVENRLAFDVEFYAKELIRRAEAEIGHFYPADEKGRKPIAYYWARVGTCSNPSCRAEVPLLKGFYLANKSDKQVYLKPIITGNKIDFAIGKGKFGAEGWMDKSALKCPICGSVTDAESIRQQVASFQISERMLAVIYHGENNEKAYRLPTPEEINVLKSIPILEAPHEKLPNVTRLTGGFIVAWGYTEWGQMFAPRQLLVMQTLVNTLNKLKSAFDGESEYGKAISTYLGILIDRVAAILNSFGRWHVSGEKMETPFSRQAIPMMFDYPEGNPFSFATGSARNNIDWILRFITSECDYPFSTNLNNASSGEKEQFSEKSITAVVTDPPYYDAIAYADLSDFFYVWLKRTLGDVFPANFATPQTPKSGECTALKHHHEGSVKKAVLHFENKLLQIFDAIEHQTSDVVSIMFAHQTTEAWTTLCNSILGARLNITGSWAIDTEMANRSVGLAGAALESSVTVSCKPASREGFGEYREVKKAIERKVEEEVAELYALGFRGADLLTACFGKAVGEFGKYERVEKASGDEVTVAELLEMTRESAFNALLKGFKGDDFTKFYIGWLELYSFTDSDFDDAAKFTRIGLSINVADLFAHDIFVKNGNKQSLADLAHRTATNKRLGENPNSSLIDQAHRAMSLYKRGDRRALLDFIGRVAPSADASFWRVLTSLDELLPKGMDDQKQAAGLLENKENLIRESQASRATAKQTGLFG